MKEQIRTSYRVDVVTPLDSYIEYTSRKGTDLGMATALGNYLKWRKAGGRIVELPSGTVIDEWKREYIPHPATAFRDSMEALKRQFNAI